MVTRARLLRSRGSRSTALLAAGGLLAGSTVIGLLPTIAGASSHREAPLIAADPAVDNTDVYAFSSPENTDDVSFVANWIPFEEPNGGPNFYPWADDAEYLINIDNNGDAKADLIYRWRFSTDDQRGNEHVPVQQRAGDLPRRPEPALPAVVHARREHRWRRARYGSPDRRRPGGAVVHGSASMGSAPDYATTCVPRPSPTSPVAARRLPPRPTTRSSSTCGSSTCSTAATSPRPGRTPSRATTSTASCSRCRRPPSPSTTTRPPTRSSASGARPTAADPAQRRRLGRRWRPGFTQVSRLGSPLVNEVVVPTGLKDAFNAISPDKDATAADGAVVNRVLDPEVPQLIQAIYGIPAPAAPRYDIFEVFLTGVVTNARWTSTGSGDAQSDRCRPQLAGPQQGGAATFQPSEMLRLNMAINGPTGLDLKPLKDASRLGVIGGDIQGFPNGRRLADDVVDIELLALEGIFDVSKVPADRQAAFDALKNGDGVAENDKAFSAEFPYIGSVHTHAVNRVDVTDPRGQGGAAAVPGTGGGGGIDRSSPHSPARPPCCCSRRVSAR